MEYLGLILFGIFFVTMFILDLSMVISLVKTGDEKTTNDYLESKHLYSF